VVADVSRVSQRVAQQRVWGELTWLEGAAGCGFLACGCSYFSNEVENVVPCADVEDGGMLGGWWGGVWDVVRRRLVPDGRLGSPREMLIRSTPA
jgi:hypothetical protein